MYADIIERLQQAGVGFQTGLSEAEFDWIEREYQLTFPLPLREFVSEALPVSGNFYNWRSRSDDNMQHIRDMLNWPLEGILFDVEHNGFWYKPWGDRPLDIEEAKRVCIKEFAKVPQLIPVYSHCYMPSVFGVGELPVYSVYQTDIIYYGENLRSYFEVEFFGKSQTDIDFSSISNVPFWGDI